MPDEPAGVLALLVSVILTQETFSPAGQAGRGRHSPLPRM